MSHGEVADIPHHMKIGIISDIHANAEALDAVLEALDRHNVDQRVCLGDVVGYGAQPNEVSTRVRDVCEVTVLGNHDAAVCGRMDYSYYRPEARFALNWHTRVLDCTHMEWLKTLQFSHASNGVTFCHGSPVALEEFGYIFVLEQMRELIEHYDRMSHVTFIGHSHLCKACSFNECGAEEVLTTRFRILPDRKYVITAGSVGQPRDNDNRACCCVYDTESQWFEYIRVAYDIDSAAKRIIEAKLSAAFGKRLFLGI